MVDLEAEAHHQLGSVYETKGEHKMAETHYKKLINMKQDSSSSLCSVLIYLAKRSEPVEAVSYLQQCRKIAGQLNKADRVIREWLSSKTIFRKVIYVPAFPCFSRSV